VSTTTVEASETTGNLFYSLGVNLAILVAKTVLGVITGSAAMLAEATHSLVDSLTAPILLAGVWHSKWWTKARFFWGLVAAVNIFVTGGLFAAYAGLRSIMNPEIAGASMWVTLAVLTGSAVLESTSLLRAARTLDRERDGVPWLRFLRTTTDTAMKTQAVEDAADVTGLVLAIVGTVLQMVTGSAVWTGIAAVLIAVLLTGMAYEVGAQNLRLLK
jgi:cation diffusion facilitator family transporter